MSDNEENSVRSSSMRSQDEDSIKINRFMEWLRENGASFPKIDFPRNDTPSGIRGAIALDDIQTNEHMMVIPARLMMAPTHIFADPIYGPILQREMKDLLRGDFLMTVYLMHEMRLREASFYKPYIDILPVPNCISEWNHEELMQLQDERIILRAKNRKKYVENSYIRVIHGLNRQHPTLFPLEEFTFENFKFAFNTIQARAFGRRLPWTALVPFADCLNHTNVQTKYDYNIDQNGMFRLFPTGRNAYPKGSEVFNSYGRRENENLLMDYGFAMMPNHWDEVDIMLLMSHEKMQDSEFMYRRELLAQRGYKLVEIFPFNYFFLPLEALHFARCITKHKVTLPIDSGNDDCEESSNESLSTDFAKMVSLNKEPSRLVNDWYVQRENELAALTFLQTTLELYLLQSSATDITEDELQLRDLCSDCSISTTVTICTASNNYELYPTTTNSLKEDGSIQPLAHREGDDRAVLESVVLDKDRYINALRYRITRKCIVQRALHLVDTLLEWISLSETRSEEENHRILQENIVNVYLNDATESDDGAIYVKIARRGKQHEYLRWALQSLVIPPPSL